MNYGSSRPTKKTKLTDSPANMNALDVATTPMYEKSSKINALGYFSFGLVSYCVKNQKSKFPITYSLTIMWENLCFGLKYSFTAMPVPTIKLSFLNLLCRSFSTNVEIRKNSAVRVMI